VCVCVCIYKLFNITIFIHGAIELLAKQTLNATYFFNECIV